MTVSGPVSPSQTTLASEHGSGDGESGGAGECHRLVTLTGRAATKDAHSAVGWPQSNGLVRRSHPPRRHLTDDRASELRNSSSSSPRPGSPQFALPGRCSFSANKHAQPEPLISTTTTIVRRSEKLVKQQYLNHPPRLKILDLTGAANRSSSDFSSSGPGLGRAEHQQVRRWRRPAPARTPPHALVRRTIRAVDCSCSRTRQGLGRHHGESVDASTAFIER